MNSIKKPIKNGEGIVWPEGKRVAAMVTFDFDAELLRISRNGDANLGFSDTSRGLYGPREGLKRCLSVLNKYDVKSTFFIPGRIAERYPERIREIDALGHEIGYHGYAHESSLDISYQEEWANMEKSELIIEELTGKRPVGHRGCYGVVHDFTIKMLQERGYIYSSVMKDCDWAYIYPETKISQPVVELPTDQSLDDHTYFYFTFNGSANRSNYPIDYVFQFWKDAFDELAEEQDKIFCLKLHPQLIGRASRAVLLDRFIKYMKGNGAWITSCKEVADYVIKSSVYKGE